MNRNRCEKHLSKDERIESIVSTGYPIEMLSAMEKRYVVKTNKRILVFISSDFHEIEESINREDIRRITKRDILTPGYEELIIEYNPMGYRENRQSRRTIRNIIVRNGHRFTDGFEVFCYEEVQDIEYENKEEKYREILGDRYIQKDEKIIKEIKGKSYSNRKTQAIFYTLFIPFFISVSPILINIYSYFGSIFEYILGLTSLAMFLTLIYFYHKVKSQRSKENYIIVTTDKLIVFYMKNRVSFFPVTYDMDVEVIEKNPLLIFTGVKIKEKKEINPMESKTILGYQEEDITSSIVSGQI